MLSLLFMDSLIDRFFIEKKSFLIQGHQLRFVKNLLYT